MGIASGVAAHYTCHMPRIDARTRIVTDLSLLRDIQRHARLDPDGVASCARYRKDGRYGVSLIARRFGTWVIACDMAGVRTAHPGTWKECSICGATFKGSTGPKSRKCCSRKCSSELMSRTHRKPDHLITMQAARGRAGRLIKRDYCRRCGSDGTGTMLHIHHRDGNPLNNVLQNLQVLCAKCHKHVERRRRIKLGLPLRVRYKPLKSHCHNGHSLTDPVNVRIHKKGPGYGRICRTCARERARLERQKRKQCIPA